MSKSLAVSLSGAATLCVAVLVVFILLRSSGSGDDAGGLAPVADHEARAALERLVALSAADDWSGLCGVRGAEGLGCSAVGGGEVLTDLRARRPTEPPTILSSEATSASDCKLPGRVLHLSGTDSSGAQYTTDLYVARDFDGGLLISMPVYWYGGRFFEGAGCALSAR